MTTFVSRSRTWLQCVAFALCCPACAAPQAEGTPLQATSAVKGLPSHFVDEGGSKQSLWIDGGQVADFGASNGNRPVIRPSKPGNEGKSDTGSSGTEANQVSPLFLDASGQPRALPGGVIVGLKEELPEPQARMELEAAGLVPLRPIGGRMWLVDSPVGIESLNLSNRLQSDTRFDFVEPNWWKPRSTK